MSTELSPAAKAVMTAWWNDSGTNQQAIAAVLRAAAEIVVPEEQLYGGDQRWVYERDARQACRDELLAIADELEGH